MPPQNQNLPQPSNLTPNLNGYQVPPQMPYAPPANGRSKPKMVALIFGLLLAAIMTFGLFYILHKPADQQAQQQPVDKANRDNLNSLKASLGSYYAEGNAGFASYPTLDQINDNTWLSENMSGVNPTQLSPPKQATKPTSEQATSTTYSYKPTPVGCTNTQTKPCSSFTLSALQSSGGTYTVKPSNE